MQKKITIILPSLNVKDYIQRCMKSVLEQTMAEIEILCVDAGSEDGTLEILREIERKDTRVRVIQSEQKSYGYQVNLGIKLANGKYIGIVETDDYIQQDMYKTLYQVAERENADYVKADYDMFQTLRDGRKVYFTKRAFKQNKSLYGKCVIPAEMPEIAGTEYGVWRGIYKCDFLKKNAINFSETAGAAFQDIGFSTQVICYAQKAVYIEDSLYRYCYDRKDASSRSLKCLQNACYEYERLLKIDGWKNEKTLRIFYTRLINSFMGEYTKVLEMLAYDAESSFFKEYKVWFKEKIHEATEKQFIDKQNFSEKVWDDFMLFMKSDKQYALKMKKHNENKNVLSDGLSGKEVVIFGHGLYGYMIAMQLDEEGIEVNCFCDNASWNSSRNEVAVLEPRACVLQYPNAYYIVANQQHTEEMIEQLMKYGVDRKQILDGRNYI